MVHFPFYSTELIFCCSLDLVDFINLLFLGLSWFYESYWLFLVGVDVPLNLASLISVNHSISEYLDCMLISSYSMAVFIAKLVLVIYNSDPIYFIYQSCIILRLSHSQRGYSILECSCLAYLSKVSKLLV